MLVLTRKVKEWIELPGLGVRVSIESITGNRVRVGVEAPREVRVLRGELCGDGKEAEGRADAA